MSNITLYTKIISFLEKHPTLKTFCKAIYLSFLSIYKSLTQNSILFRIKVKLFFILHVRKNIPHEIWFTHLAGGGAHKYLLKEIEKNQKERVIFCIQEAKKSTFIVTIYHNAHVYTVLCKNMPTLMKALKDVKINFIIVNNLFGYSSHESIFKFISDLKQKHNCHVSYRLHDFQSICPNVFMTNAAQIFCNFDNISNCSDCFPNIKNPFILVDSVQKWHIIWQKFFADTVDEIICFSESSKVFLLKAYPQLQTTIKIIPHTIAPLRQVKIKKHNSINIGIIGHITPHKGANIINEMSSYAEKIELEQDVKINIIIIGYSYEIHSDNVTILGHYNPDALPDIIEQNFIDIVFMSSIWPETFSYVVSEVISMGLPLACFNIGAQGERCKQYAKGLLLEKMHAEAALIDMLKYVANIQQNIK